MAIYQYATLLVKMQMTIFTCLYFAGKKPAQASFAKFKVRAVLSKGAVTVALAFCAILQRLSP